MTLQRWLRGFGTRSAPGSRGELAETVVARWLHARGMRVVERNVRTPFGEIDLVVEDGSTLCFVEVRARSRGDRGGPLATVDRRKRRRLTRAAAWYLAQDPVERAVRLDVVGLERDGGRWRLLHLPGAFEAESESP